MATAISLSLWQWMPTATCGKRWQTSRVIVEDLVGETAAVGVAQAQAVGAGFGRGGQRLQRVVRIVLVAVEEVLGVEHHFLAVLLEVAHRVADHAQVLVERRAQDFQHLVVPALAEDGDGGGAGLEQRLDVGIVGDALADLARRAEGDDARVPAASACGARAKNSRSFGLEPGLPASM